MWCLKDFETKKWVIQHPIGQRSEWYEPMDLHECFIYLFLEQRSWVATLVSISIKQTRFHNQDANCQHSIWFWIPLHYHPVDLNYLVYMPTWIYGLNLRPTDFSFKRDKQCLNLDSTELYMITLNNEYKHIIIFRKIMSPEKIKWQFWGSPLILQSPNFQPMDVLKFCWIAVIFGPRVWLEVGYNTQEGMQVLLDYFS